MEFSFVHAVMHLKSARKRIVLNAKNRIRPVLESDCNNQIAVEINDEYKEQEEMQEIDKTLTTNDESQVIVSRRRRRITRKRFENKVVVSSKKKIIECETEETIKKARIDDSAEDELLSLERSWDKSKNLNEVIIPIDSAIREIPNSETEDSEEETQFSLIENERNYEENLTYRSIGYSKPFEASIKSSEMQLRSLKNNREGENNIESDLITDYSIAEDSGLCFQTSDSFQSEFRSSKAFNRKDESIEILSGTKTIDKLLKKRTTRGNHVFLDAEANRIALDTSALNSIRSVLRFCEDKDLAEKYCRTRVWLGSISKCAVDSIVQLADSSNDVVEDSMLCRKEAIQTVERFCEKFFEAIGEHSLGKESEWITRFFIIFALCDSSSICEEIMKIFMNKMRVFLTPTKFTKNDPESIIQTLNYCFRARVTLFSLQMILEKYISILTKSNDKTKDNDKRFHTVTSLWNRYWQSNDNQRSTIQSVEDQYNQWCEILEKCTIANINIYPELAEITMQCFKQLRSQNVSKN